MIRNHKDAIAARESLREPPVLTLIHNADIETNVLDATVGRLTSELRQLSTLLRATRRDMEAMENLRMSKADALEAAMRQLAARAQ